jgi:hypothetical protein|tara:strand:+ start:1169 stop:1339 length:171 start_codon:yes stop_codon:yes gene_type:complete
MQDDVQKILDKMTHKIATLNVAQSKNKAAIIVLKARVVDLKMRMAELEKLNKVKGD